MLRAGLPAGREEPVSDRLSSVARLQFLGAQRIEIGNEVLTPEAERLFGMIVRLSLPLGRMVSRQTMMDTLWPGADDANARHNLRQTVYKAREMGLVVESGEDGLRLDPRHWSCDWDDPVGEVGGEWLAGYEPGFSEELMAWITAQRLGVHALIRPRIIRSLQTARSAGDMVVADRYATQLLGIDELNEEATLTRAELMAMQGAKVDALKLLDGYLAEIGRMSTGRDAGLPAQLLRRRIAEKLPSIAYQSGGRHHGPLVGRVTESRALIAGLFDARAGRGGGFLLHGPEGSGKSRLLHELRQSAVLQGMRVLEHHGSTTPSATPFAMLRTVVRRLLELPGALGVTPEALEVLRAWQQSRDFAPDDCPLAEIEDLLAAVSEETPLLLQVDQGDRIDAESLGRLDRVYRRGVSRYHLLVVASATHRTPWDSPVELQGLSRIALRPMSAVEVRAVVTAYAVAEQPRATQEQIGCAAVFAEGVPMYGIEMLGLMLDAGSPDVIPWRVQVAVDRALRDLSEVQWRVLTLTGCLGEGSRYEVVDAALQVDRPTLATAIDGLEAWGYVQADDGMLRASSLMSDGAELRLKANVVRMDALHAAQLLLVSCEAELQPVDFYACLRLFVRARQEVRAQAVLDRHAGALLRRDTAQSVVFELTRLRQVSRSPGLGGVIDAIVDQVRSGAESRRPRLRHRRHSELPKTMPVISAATTEVEHKFASTEMFRIALTQARSPENSPALRLTEAVMALFVASNHEDISGLESAYRAVSSIRHSPDINHFDLCRADLIYLASTGQRAKAKQEAHRLASLSRTVPDIQLACKGLRNAALVCGVYGDTACAQGYLHESRLLASELEYYAQVAWADLRLADLCLNEMDTAGAREYLEDAARIVDKNRLLAPLLEADLNLFCCWESLASGDFQRAQRSARVVMRRISAAQRTGTTLWTYLGVKLATRRGAYTKEVRRDVELLKSSIGRNHFYPNENYSLAALLLGTSGTSDQHETHRFVAKQLPRLKASGRGVWPMISNNIAE
jgi:hypothetical protein